MSELERSWAKLVDGSPHPHYRQPTWRGLYNVRPAEIAMSDRVEGDPHASKFRSRTWRRAAVIGIKSAVWSQMVEDYPGSVPALIYRIGDDALRVGRLASHDDLGTIQADGHEFPGHGLRFGRYPLQFTIALVAPDHPPRTPPEDAIINQDPIDVSIIGQPGTGYEHMYFSS